MFEDLKRINSRPRPFEFYTAQDLWTDEHVSKQMLSYHLNDAVDLASRNTAFVDRSVEWIASRFKIERGTRIADFGCGPGLYATRLARRRARVTGIDFSTSSIQYARNVADRERLPITYVNRNYLEFETDDRFHLILMIMCDFCALSPVQRRIMLDKFFDLLVPGGHVALDVHSLAAFDQRQESAMYEPDMMNGFWSPNTYYGFLNTFKYENEKVVLDKYTIVEADRTQTIYNWLQYFRPDSLEREFAASGFMIEDLYSDVAGLPYTSEALEIAVAAVKP